MSFAASLFYFAAAACTLSEMTVASPGPRVVLAEQSVTVDQHVVATHTAHRSAYIRRGCHRLGMRSGAVRALRWLRRSWHSRSDPAADVRGSPWLRAFG